MTQGICFYADYPMHTTLCSVAIHSLRKYYDGDIHVIHGEHCPRAFLWGLERQSGVTFAPARQATRHAVGGKPIGRVRTSWFRKPYLHDESPFDETIMYDCDHLFISKFDMAAFDFVQEFGLVSFHPRPASVRSYKQKARRVRVVMRDREYQFHYPANGGCVGSLKASGASKIWCHNMERILKHEVHATRSMGRVADEYALAYTIRKIGGMGDAKWSCGVDRVDTTTIGIHFARKAYIGNPLFLSALKEATDDECVGLHKLKPPPMAQHNTWLRRGQVQSRRKARHRRNPPVELDDVSDSDSSEHLYTSPER